MPLLEKALIAKIRGRSRLWPGVVFGIGDDCATLKVPSNHEILVTTDFSLEGVHFRLDWHTAGSVGHRCLIRGLSDIAAMGGNPVAAFLSLALPKKLNQKWVDSFLEGFMRLANRYKVTLAGGDIAQSPGGVLADIVVVGSVPRNTALTRSAARPGDFVYVTGELGGSAAVLRTLRRGGRANQSAARRFSFPEPRLKSGQFLRKSRLATAMIDISDGLSTDLSHICEESRVGARLFETSIPRASIHGKKVALDLALHGGDDYELLFTAAPGKKIPAKIGSVRVTRIGEITRQRGIQLVNERGKSRSFEIRGWQHFSQ